MAASDGDRVAVAWAQAPRIWRAAPVAPDGRGTNPSLAVSAVRARLQRGAAQCAVANGRRYCAAAPLRVTVLLQAAGRGELEASFERVGVRVHSWWFLRARPGANRLSFACTSSSAEPARAAGAPAAAGAWSSTCPRRASASRPW